MNINQDELIQSVYASKKEMLVDILEEIFSLEEVYELICNNEKLIVPKNSHNTRLNIKATNIQHIDNNINIEPYLPFSRAYNSYSRIRTVIISKYRIRSI